MRVDQEYIPDNLKQWLNDIKPQKVDKVEHLRKLEEVFGNWHRRRKSDKTNILK